jgi:hypothetical protein
MSSSQQQQFISVIVYLRVDWAPQWTLKKSSINAQLERTETQKLTTKGTKDKEKQSSTFHVTSSLPPPPSGRKPLVGRDFLIIESSRSHSDTPQSVGLLWTIDRLVAETSTWQDITLKTDRHPYPRQDSNPQFQQVSGRIFFLKIRRPPR